MPSRINIGPENGPYIAINENNGDIELEDNTGAVVAKWDDGQSQWDFVENDISGVGAFDSESVNTDEAQIDGRGVTSNDSIDLHIDAENGSDDNDGTSESDAFETWDRLMKEVPHILHNSYSVTIHGDISEPIQIRNRYCAASEFAGLVIGGDTDDPSNHELSGGIEIINCSGVIDFRDVRVTDTFDVIGSVLQEGPIRDAEVEVNDDRGIDFKSAIGRVANVNVGGSDVGVHATQGGFARTRQVSGNAISNGLEAKGGFILDKGDSTVTGDENDSKEFQGGRIFTDGIFESTHYNERFIGAINLTNVDQVDESFEISETDPGETYIIRLRAYVDSAGGEELQLDLTGADSGYDSELEQFDGTRDPRSGDSFVLVDPDGGTERIGAEWRLKFSGSRRFGVHGEGTALRNDDAKTLVKGKCSDFTDGPTTDLHFSTGSSSEDISMIATIWREQNPDEL